MMRSGANDAGGLGRRWWIVVIFLMTLGDALGASVTLAWDPNTEPDIAGYKLYYGTPSGSFSTVLNVGNVTNATVNTLVAGSTYAFYVTCYNTSGLESEPSNVVEYTVPTTGGGNQVPLALGQTVNAISGEEVVITLAGADPDGDPLSFNIASFPESGDLTGYAVLNGSTATIRYRSAPGFVGGDAFTFNVNDGYEVSADATVSIQVAPGTPPPAVGWTWYLQAESGGLTAPLAAVADPSASGGWGVATATSEQGSVNYDFEVPVEGDYVVWCRVKATSGGSDSFYVTVDNNLATRDIFDMAALGYSPDWQWTVLCGRGGVNNPVDLAFSVSPRVFHWLPGTHRLTFQGRERNSGLDALVITSDTSFDPVVAEASMEPPVVASSVVVAGGGGVQLEWPSIPGRGYQLAYKDRVDDAGWTLLPTVYSASGTSLTVAVGAAGNSQRFYSVVLLP